jgi:tetratricopeptide (TPR) repeat protein
VGRRAKAGAAKSEEQVTALLQALLQALQTLANSLSGALRKSPEKPGRWDRVSKAARTLLTVTFVLVITTVLFSNTFKKNTVVIDNFMTNSELQRRGYDDRIVTMMLAHKISVMIQGAESIKKSRELSVPLAKELPDVEVPGTKISAKNIILYLEEFPPLRYVRRTLGLNPIRVSGEASAHGETVTINLRISRDVGGGAAAEAKTLTGPVQEIDTLVANTGEQVLGYAEPYIMASYFYRSRRTDETLAQLQYCMRQGSPGQARLARVLWSLILIDQKKYDEAIAKLEEVTGGEKPGEDSREYVAAYNNWGLALLYQRKFDKAVSKFDEAIRHDPDHPLTYLNYGKALLDMGEKAKAVEKFERALRLDPKLAVGYYNLAYALQKDKPLDAVALYRTAIKLNPEDADARSGLGLLLLNAKPRRTGEAVDLLKSAIERDQDSASAHANLGLALAYDGDFKQATDELKVATGLYERLQSEGRDDKAFVEDFANAYNNLGSVYEAQKDYRSALANYENSLRVNPAFYLAYTGKGDVLRKTGEFGGALAAYESVLRQPGADGQSRFFAYKGKGLLLSEGCRGCAGGGRRAEVETAVRMFEEALKIDDPKAVGDEQKQEVSEALEKARRVLERLPNNTR